MTDEVIEQPTGDKPGETAAAPETKPAASGATAAPGEQPKPGEVTFSAEQQARVNEIVADRLARDRAKRERDERAELNRLRAEKSAPVVATESKDPEAPKREDFESYEEWVRADARHVARQEVKAERETQAKAEKEAKAKEEFQRVQATHAEREKKAMAKYADYAELVLDDPTLPITDAMAHALMTEDDGAELAYWLAHNREEAQRIARLTPFLQAKEIGRLGERFKAPADPTPKPAPVSKAPEPIDPVGGKGGAAASTKPPSDPNEYRRWRTAQREAEAQRARA